MKVDLTEKHVKAERRSERLIRRSGLEPQEGGHHKGDRGGKFLQQSR